MTGSRSTRRGLSLADVVRGEVVQVEEIIFDLMREFLQKAGVIPGAELRCEARTADEVVCRGADGRPVVIDPFYASFVAVRRSRRRMTREGARVAKRPPPSTG